MLNCHFLPNNGAFFFFLLPNKNQPVSFQEFSVFRVLNPHFFPRMVCFSSPLPPPKKTENAQNFLKSALKESWHLFDQPPCSKVTYIAARPGIYRASVFGLRHGWTVTRGKSDITRGSLEENGVSFFGKRDRKLETQPNG